MLAVSPSLSLSLSFFFTTVLHKNDFEREYWNYLYEKSNQNLLTNTAFKKHKAEFWSETCQIQKQQIFQLDTLNMEKTDKKVQTLTWKT